MEKENPNPTPRSKIQIDDKTEVRQYNVREVEVGYGTMQIVDAPLGVTTPPEEVVLLQVMSDDGRVAMLGFPYPIITDVINALVGVREAIRRGEGN